MDEVGRPRHQVSFDHLALGSVDIWPQGLGSRNTDGKTGSYKVTMGIDAVSGPRCVILAGVARGFDFGYRRDLTRFD